ncbi:FIST C-terminal domain-containing protein [Ectothiorhodospira haloalkaliphila]|uniref:FIST signal transduction protein n=1 Tax=Ectothiorhodospira TaxID=1051 RepID=UPI001EE85EED|nr:MULTISPECIES: FIST C-terminal domain-containing protein [Ectothiorhodospira]MCG5498526.1 FIST C-terminal domain-containing protein [Ectothiorhodospira variabilis]MCG5525909.1 FIST C-terminal domain-containing protein [Ectothiorhodospira haloalkaliphila]
MTSIWLERSGTREGLATVLERAHRAPGVQGLMILSCVGDHDDIPALEELLSRQKLALFGGLFPGLIFNGEELSRGSIVVGLPVAPLISTVTGLSLPGAALDALSRDLACDAQGEGKCTLVAFVDAFSTRIADLVSAMFDQLGLDCNYLGAGAGALDGSGRACVLTPDGVMSDAAVLARLSMPSSIGVAHGWVPVSEPVKVSRVEQNRVMSLNARPAFDVYAELIRAHSGVEITLDNFFSVARSYPLGMCRLRGERVVRDPLSVDEQGTITCVADVPEGMFVELLHGAPPDLIRAADRAVAQAEAGYPGSTPPAFGLVCDCISRALFMADGFSAELRAMRRDYPLVGMLSVGEIANCGLECLEFYNKAVVLGLLAEREPGSGP